MKKISNITDLTEIKNNDISAASEEAIIKLLHSRFKSNKPYTQIGQYRLIVINPLKPLDLLNDATLEAYGNRGYKELSLDNYKQLPEPHVYELATKAYLLMRRKCEDQVIVLRGSLGSGKSTTLQHLINEFLYLSNSNKENTIKNQLLGINTIFQSFGTVNSTSNKLSSCLNQLETLQFNERGRLVGFKTSIFLFDKYRISHSNMQNYNIFYQLLAGTTQDEKNALHIARQNFNYLQLIHERNSEQDLIKFNDLKEALKVCGFKTKTIAQICQLLAAILHIGNLLFLDGKLNFSGDTSYASFSNLGGTTSESCFIKNKEVLNIVAVALGVAAPKLETALTHKVKLIGNEFCTAFLTPTMASEQRDTLAQTLYSVLLLWITNALNQKFGAEYDNIALKTINILDTVGFNTNIKQQIYTFHDFCVNYAAEQLHQYSLDRVFNPYSQNNLSLVLDGIWPNNIPVQINQRPSALQLYHGTDNGGFALIPLINKESERLQTYATDATDSNLLSLFFQQKKNPDQYNDYLTFINPSSPVSNFAIRHYDSINVDYSINGFLESNLDLVSPDFVHLFRNSCTNAFVNYLFQENPLTSWVTECHPRDQNAITKAQLPVWPNVTLERNQEISEKGELKSQHSHVQTVLDQVVQGVQDLKDILNKLSYFEIIHLAPNDQQKPNVFDKALVQNQLETLRVTELAAYTTYMDNLQSYSFKSFISRYNCIIDSYLPSEEYEEDENLDKSRTDGKEENDDEQNIIKNKGRIFKWIKLIKWSEKEIQLGQNQVWLAFDSWRYLECKLHSIEIQAKQDEKERLAAIKAEKLRMAAIQDEENDFNYSNDLFNTYTEDNETDIETHVDSVDKDINFQKLPESPEPNVDMSKMMVDHDVKQNEHIEEVNITPLRRWWTRFVYLCTWWVPTFTLKYIGKMSRQDIQMAWREKLTLCLMIFLFSGSIIFFIVGLSAVICPGTDNLFSAEDLSGHQSIDDYWVSVRGKVYDVTKFISSDHGTPVYPAGKSNLDSLAGRDLSYTFPPPLTIACAGLVTDSSVFIAPNETVIVGPFVHYSGSQQPERTLEKLRDPYWLNKYFGPTMNVYKKGEVVIPMKQIKEDYENWGRLIAAIDDRVYDITDYMATAKRFPTGIEGVPNYHYLDFSVETLFKKFGGKDVTEEWNRYSAAMSEEKRIQNKACLDNVFYIGRIDYREDIKCTFVNYLLLSFAFVMSFVMLVKFLAALQFGSAPTPEDHDRFVICQVPCYTEDEDSLRKTIDSLTAMTYDDKHKLLFLVADGMIIGSGNSKPTPRILLDILGHDESEDPEALMFKSIGEGSKRLNYGKVYSGIYEYEGHVVPYIVVVKVGRSSERTKPGNRGKRDSQIICMGFLNKVHFDLEMTPLELEIYYHMKHIIGIDPGLYEYILMVDSDTEVYPDSLNRLISCMLHDSRIIGLCGETELGNGYRSWATMIQVYEYYISHHLVKSFESLFGSVTCLPGCFCMYRIRTANNHQPLIIAPDIITAYSENQVDTLHKKNLLHLGEDRYLTTIMMKNFPQYKLMFTPYAKCKTVAPDQWRVLLSQRRRWINSTIHNLLELVLLQELCGFCCLSMRFVVLTDLIGTITLPSSVVYLAYLIYQSVAGTGPIPTIALGMFAGAYGLQSLIFILKRQWQHVGWMIIYILAIPIFSFFIPLYAFWHFDDFSWGNTRVVLGDNKKQIIVIEDEKYDDSMIPLKKWSVYEQEMWDARTVFSEGTTCVSSRRSNDCYSETQSIYSNSKGHRRPRYKNYHNNHSDARTLRSHSSIVTSGSYLSRNSHRRQLVSPLIHGFAEKDPFSHLSADHTPIFKQRPSISQSSRLTANDIHINMLPSDEEIEREIKKILLSSNLTVLTKYQVRDRLSAIFGVNLAMKKEFINATIEHLLERDEV